MRYKLIVGGLDHTNAFRILVGGIPTPPTKQEENPYIPFIDSDDEPLKAIHSLYESIFKVSHRFSKFELLDLYRDSFPANSLTACYLTYCPSDMRPERANWVNVEKIACGEDKKDGRIYISDAELNCIEKALHRRIGNV